MNMFGEFVFICVFYFFVFLVPLVFLVLGVGIIYVCLRSKEYWGVFGGFLVIIMFGLFMSGIVQMIVATTTPPHINCPTCNERIK